MVIQGPKMIDIKQTSDEMRDRQIDRGEKEKIKAGRKK